MAFTMESPAFAQGALIPRRFAGEGDDVSPSLKWAGAPSATKEFALVCDDPDAPRATPWVHWLLYNIPQSVTELPENLAKDDPSPLSNEAKQGKNSWERLGYGGPMPPLEHGLHHYNFVLYALDHKLELPAGATVEQLQEKMKGHILGEARLIGTYERKSVAV